MTTSSIGATCQSEKYAYPDFACTLQTNRIAAPYILRIDIRDADVLNNNVGATDKPQAFAFTVN